MMRQDSMVLAAHRDLALSALDISDGVLPNGNDEGANQVLDLMLEINHIRGSIKDIPDTPLFSSYDDAHKFLKKGQLSESIKAQKSYFLECQQNDK